MNDSAKHRVRVKYEIRSKYTGFDVSLLRDEDVADAIIYVEALADDELLISRATDYKSDELAELDWRKFLRKGALKIWEPEDLIDISAHTNNKKGWLLRLSEDRWEDELRLEYSRDFRHILDQRKKGKLPPAITIGGEFADGRGRTLLQYALGEQIPAINLEIKSKGEATGEVWYHGRSADSTDFDYSHTGKGHDQEGPGFYFTSDFKDAERYAGATGIIMEVRLNLKKLVPENARRSDLEFLIKNAQDYLTTLTDFDENPAKAFKMAVDLSLNDDKPYQQVWYDFYRNSPSEYLKNMVKLGYDGHEATWTRGLRHMIVYNPNSIQIVKVHTPVKDASS